MTTQPRREGADAGYAPTVHGAGDRNGGRQSRFILARRRSESCPCKETRAGDETAGAPCGCMTVRCVSCGQVFDRCG